MRACTPFQKSKNPPEKTKSKLDKQASITFPPGPWGRGKKNTLEKRAHFSNVPSPLPSPRLVNVPCNTPVNARSHQQAAKKRHGPDEHGEGSPAKGHGPGAVCNRIPTTLRSGWERDGSDGRSAARASRGTGSVAGRWACALGLGLSLGRTLCVGRRGARAVAGDDDCCCACSCS